MELALPWMHMREIDAEVDADEALVARVAAGERQALEQLYARWASPLPGLDESVDCQR